MRIADIHNILSWKIPPHLSIWNHLIMLKKIILLARYGPIQDSITSPKHLDTYKIQKKNFDPINKKIGISGIARLKNSAEFLEISIRSHIAYFDEILLVDNQSTDNTLEICKKLKKDFPQKIKILTYPSIVKLGTREFAKSVSHEVTNIAYYYNRVLSHTTYTWSAKIDDDHLAIPDIMSSNRKKILSDTNRSTYYQMLWINILRDSVGQIGIPVHQPFMW